jgi:riboflavin synthase
MFTGIIEEKGLLKSIVDRSGGKRITVECTDILSDIKIDDSISINGVCQTVVKIGYNCFEVDAVEETLKKTTIRYWRNEQTVNLERALKMSDRLGGHLVMGHVDTIGEIIQKTELDSSIKYEILFPKEFSKYTIQHGSIAIDGISLTIAENYSTTLLVSVIPHTLSKTNIVELKKGDKVNLEFDMLGKYVEKLLYGKTNDLTFDKLKDLGY